MAPPPDAGPRLLAIKLLHTVVWAGFVACILGVPVTAARGRFDLAVLFAVVVFGEVVVLGLNRWTCPLTPVAARYTEDRRPNFDIFLPEWLARYNKHIFGPLYVLGLVYLAVAWLSG